MSLFCIQIFLLFLFTYHVQALDSTDTITWGGDNSRTGYQTNHNMDPSIVASDQFTQIFKTSLPGVYNGAVEQVFSQPLVYTPSGSNGSQFVYLSTTQNNLYKIDAKTGTIILQRNLHIPFLAMDLNGCVDINPCIGVTGTGVIDPATETLYLTSKTYLDQNGGDRAQGKPNGRYYLHAINVNDLTERPNFPVDLEGTFAKNNPMRSFNAGIQLQRPALLHTGQFIYAGFASQCAQYNFTGWIIGWDKTTGQIVEAFATEGSGVLSTTPGGGIWMSGGGLASDDAGSLYFASGNGYASQLSAVPVNGRNPPTALEEAAVHMAINTDGSLSIVDFFMPWEKNQLDGADRDLGTSPLELLPSEFSCGNVRRMGVVTGKSGKTYWLNLDNMGGYQNGPNKLDDIVQVYQNENSVYSGAGVYPLEGGYIYINVIKYPTHVFKFSCNAEVPSFTKVADSPTKNAFVLGVGHGTTTSLKGQPGTGLVWTSDVDGQNLRVYKAVPENGLMTLIKGFNVPGTTKFTRPVFGDGRVYMGTTKGYFYGFGSPVNLPINCSSPYDFGTVDISSKNTSIVLTVTCLASISLSVTNVNLTSDTNFRISGQPPAPLSISRGESFSFKAYFVPQSVGSLSSDVIISTKNNVVGYSNTTPVTIRGTGKSSIPVLVISPANLSFPGVVVTEQAGGVNQSVIFNNRGSSPLTVQDIQYSLKSETGPFIKIDLTVPAPTAGAFTFIGLPNMIPGMSSTTVTVKFATSNSGNFSAYLRVQYNGGVNLLKVVGTAGSAPVALLEFQDPNGQGWVTYKSGQNFTFGNVTENTTRFLKLRLTNNATTDSAPLSLTVSKPPFDAGSIIKASNLIDLAEGTTLAPGESSMATLYCSVPKQQWNMDPYSRGAQWTMNVDDPNFGKQFIKFDCTAVSEQAAPLDPAGLAFYRYTGCFKENNPGRQLKILIYNDPKNTIAQCIAACSATQSTFCGLQYNRECWGGPTIPTQAVDEGNCNYPCSGNINQICGGNGVGPGAGGSYISLFVDRSHFDGNVTDVGPIGPFLNPGVGGYNYLGCYTEATVGRAFSSRLANPTQNVASCVTACSAKGYLYAGLEYGGECWCGNFFGVGSVPAPATDCNMACYGNATEFCGAGKRLSVYQNVKMAIIPATPNPKSTGGPQVKAIVGNFVENGCWTEATGQRALRGKSYTSDNMTLESCESFCQGALMFGTEYGRECYCGSSLEVGSRRANLADCSFPCPGDGTEFCGAGNRLQLYALNGTKSMLTALAHRTT